MSDEEVEKDVPAEEGEEGEEDDWLVPDDGEAEGANAAPICLDDDDANTAPATVSAESPTVPQSPTPHPVRLPLPSPSS